MKLTDLSEGMRYHIGDVRADLDNFTNTVSRSGTRKINTAASYKSPKFYDILSQKVSRHVKHDIIILTGNDFEGFEGSGDFRLAELSEVTGIPASEFRKSITLLIVGDGGQDKVSPWLILHQLGEAITRKGHYAWEEVVIKYEEYLKHAPGISGVDNVYTRAYNQNKEGDFESIGRTSWALRAWHSLFKMRSAREMIHGSFGNIDPGQELITEYLWHGSRIRINYPDWIDPKVVDAIKHDLETLIEQALDQLVGERISNNPLL